MHYIKQYVLLACLILILWPFTSFALEDGQTIANLTEPSGAVWHVQKQSLFIVGDEGDLYQLNAQGEVLNTWHPGGDLEGVTVVNEQSDFIYLLTECPQQILQFNLSTGLLTGRSWTLEGMAVNCSSSPTKGAEALTYNSDRGEFYVGSQEDGQIYIYNFDLNSSATVDYSDIIETGINHDLSGLSYDSTTNLLYAIFDNADLLQVYSPSHQLLTEYSLPGTTQEGIGVSNNFIFITQDSGEVIKYDQGADRESLVMVETSSSGVPYIYKTLDDQYQISVISLSDLKEEGVPEGTEVLIMPGSSDYLSYVSYTTRALDSDLVAHLQDFVNQGGGFVGICGGSIVGSALLRGGSYYDVAMADLLPVYAVDYPNWINQRVNTLSFNDHVIAGDYALGIHDVDYYGGPVFENYKDVEVVATYTEQINDPTYENIGKPAIVAKDKIVLTAVHPEYKRATRFLLHNMIAYALGEISQPETEIIDHDNDGYSEDEDCNDNDASIFEEQIYYLDNDQDGLGDPNTTALTCSNTAPAGYVTNSSDSNDNDYDNDGVETGIDCDDSDETIAENQTYYADDDGDGLGDPEDYIVVCSYEIPEGYVNNAADEDDNFTGEDTSEQLLAKLKGKYIYLNGQRIKLFRKKPLKSRYYITASQDKIIVIGLFKKRATIIVLSLDADYNVVSLKKKIIRYKRIVKKLKIRLHKLKVRFFQ